MFNNSLFAQDSISNDNSISQQLENLAESSLNEEDDYTNLLEALIYYKEHQINLNKTNKEELQKLYILSDIQINYLLNHIQKNGALISIYELQSVSGFDVQTIQKLIPYVTVGEIETSTSINDVFKNGKHELLLRGSQLLEKQKGYTAGDSSTSSNSRYLGSPQKFYTRYKFNYNNKINWGITTEKDQGESFKKGFDFYSAHLFVKNIGFVKSLAIGDYQIGFGQGLTAWSGLSFGKSSDIMSIKRVASGIRPYTSVDENRFMRGTALTLGYKRWDATGFVSVNTIDANISDTLRDGSTQAVSSLQTSGLHSTANELADKDAVKQIISGGHVSYNSNQLNIGMTAINYQLNKLLEPTLSYYNQFDFKGNNNSNVGIDYNYVFKNINIFGEQSISKNGGKALLNGLLISLDPRLSLNVVHRHYQKNYRNLMNNTFSENTRTANENGIYTGASIKISNALSFNTYYDFYSFPWLKYQVNAPSSGNDFLMQINYTPSKKTDMYFRFRKHNKQKNSSDEDADIDYLVPIQQNNYRFNIGYSILPSVQLRNRVELVNYQTGNNKTEKGYMMFQDIVFKPLQKNISVTMRYALFQTDSYNARIYAYENDVPGAYSIPAYNNRGSRFYVLLSYKINKHIQMWLRYTQTIYDNLKIINEGTLNEIDGQRQSEIKIQLKFIL